MGGTLKVDTLQNNAGTKSTDVGNLIDGNAKAWVCFNGATPTIRKSLGVSSVTKSATGTFNINFSTPFADTNYSMGSGVSYNDGTNALAVLAETQNSQARSTTSIRVIATAFQAGNSAAVDPSYASAQFYD